VPYPIALPPAHVRRILERRATLLILSRRLPPALYLVHDQRTTRRNAQRCAAGRPELQDDPLRMSILVVEVRETTVCDLEYSDARAAGYRDCIELLEDWQRRHRRIDLDQPVHAHHFRHAELPRLLAASTVQADYVIDPAHAAWDVPEAVSATEQADITAEARQAERHRSRQPYRALRDRLVDERDRALALLRHDGGDRQLERAVRVLSRSIAEFDRAI
jgi:hypothetical protein